MPDDRISIDRHLVARLIATQFPEWRHLPVGPVDTSGWDNHTFRLGDAISVRLPSAERYAAQVAKEHAWLPRLAPGLPLAIPAPLAMGAPGEGYPWPWSVYRWIAGETVVARATWDAAMAAVWEGEPVWVHGDVSDGNLLVLDGELHAVLDFGLLAVGDPACDLAIAWTTFNADSRQAFRNRLRVDDATWARGRGWALWKALITLAGASNWNTPRAQSARQTLATILGDYQPGAKSEP